DYRDGQNSSRGDVRDERKHAKWNFVAYPSITRRWTATSVAIDLVERDVNLRESVAMGASCAAGGRSAAPGAQHRNAVVCGVIRVEGKRRRQWPSSVGEVRSRHLPACRRAS